MFRTNGLCQWSGYRPGDVNGGVSSANAALELAYLLAGANGQIVLSGIDLVLIDGKTHIEGTQVEFNPDRSKEKWKDIKCNDGETRQTIPVWERCLKEYESNIFKREKENHSLFNTSKEGAGILGARFTEWEILHSHVFNKEIDAVAIINDAKGPKGATAEEYATYTKKKQETALLLKEFFNEGMKLRRQVADSSLISNREGFRQLALIETFRFDSDPLWYTKDGFWQAIEELRKKLTVLHTNPCKDIDEFKIKYLTKECISQSVIDICQLDYFTAENRVGMMRNLTPVKHLALKHYVNIQMHLMLTLFYYAQALVKMWETGVDQTYNFRPYYFEEMNMNLLTPEQRAKFEEAAREEFVMDPQKA